MLPKKTSRRSQSDVMLLSTTGSRLFAVLLVSHNRRTLPKPKNLGKMEKSKRHKVVIGGCASEIRSKSDGPRFVWARRCGFRSDNAVETGKNQDLVALPLKANLHSSWRKQRFGSHEHRFVSCGGELQSTDNSIYFFSKMLIVNTPSWKTTVRCNHPLFFVFYHLITALSWKKKNNRLHINSTIEHTRRRFGKPP